MIFNVVLEIFVLIIFASCLMDKSYNLLLRVLQHS